MKELSENQYESVRKFTREIDCETAYPDSILSGMQTGRILVDREIDPHSVIFWHYCGIAYVTGETNNDLFNQALHLLLKGEYETNQKKFYLIVSKESTNWNRMLKNICDKDSTLEAGERFYFEFDQAAYRQSTFSMPEGFAYFTIEEKHLDGLSGRVIPNFSWGSSADFLAKGKGFGVYDIENNRIASTAFSSAIGDGKIDIGIETQPEYRKKGFATLVVARMIDYVLQCNLTPDWGCDATNIGSAATATKVGFHKAGCCNVYKLKEQMRIIKK